MTAVGQHRCTRITRRTKAGVRYSWWCRTCQTSRGEMIADLDRVKAEMAAHESQETRSA